MPAKLVLALVFLTTVISISHTTAQTTPTPARPRNVTDDRKFRELAEGIPVAQSAGDLTKVVEMSRELIALAPDHPLGYFGLADGLMGQRKYEDAVIQLTKAIDRAPWYKSLLSGQGSECTG
jgi:tetratricopeptide (TPR) repeat protein